ncbi:MAG: hypothetical protein E3J86_06095 [Candidatus Thorarchaeota archaeon]|nr:MAG: hypothetical protein E3J86_06095 [Candidatus Thorarchaeota archaeon]
MIMNVVKKLKTQTILACLVLLVIVSSSSFGVTGSQVAQDNRLGYEIAINGTHAFVTNNEGVAVYTIEDTSAPARVGQISLGGEARGITLVENVLYIGALSRGLVIANISENPTDPTILSEYILGDYVTEVCIDGNYAFISSGFGETQILDISDPSNLDVLGHLPISELTLDIAVSGSTVYVARPNSGLRLIDVGNLNSPSILSLVSDTSGARDLHVQGDLLYVARGTSGVSIFDISDSASPVAIGQYNDGGHSFGLHGDSQYLCIADLQEGVELLDISIPESPVEIAHYEDAAPHDLIYKEGYAYLADQDEEFLLIDIVSSVTYSNSSSPTTGGTPNPSLFVSIVLVFSAVFAVVIVLVIMLKKRY